MAFWDPPASQVQAPQTWQMPPSAMTQVAGDVMGGINNLGQYNQYGANMGQAQGITQGLNNNPYANQWMQGAQQAGGMGMQGAQNMFNQGANMYGGANAAMQTGFDPQSALYNRTFNQNQQQNRASQASRGIMNSPYGAGLENQANSNFNMDWQNQQLQRQLAALQGAGGASALGAQMQGQAPGMYNQSSAMPYNAYQGIGQQQMGNLQQLGQFGQAAGNQAMQPIQQQLALLGVGNQANQTANQNFNSQLQQSQMGWNQQKDMFGGLGKMLGWGGQMFGGGGPGGGFSF